MMSAAANHAPVNTRAGGEDLAARVVAPPPQQWNQVVRGDESEPIVSSVAAASAVGLGKINCSPSEGSFSKLAAAAVSDSSTSSVQDDCAVEAQRECSGNGNGSGNGNAGKKPAWNKPSNDAIEVGPVMGAVSWPALSESTKTGQKPSSSESLKALSDGSVSVSQVVTNSSNLTLSPIHPTTTSQKYVKSDGASSSGSASANGGLPQQPPSVATVVERSSNITGKPGSGVPDSSSRDHAHRESGRRGAFGSHSQSGNHHAQQRNSSRRGNGSPHLHNDGSFHQNYGARRYQDHWNHDWNSSHSFNGRDARIQPQRVVNRGFTRTSPRNTASFIPPPVSIQPFSNHMVYPDIASQVIYVQAPLPPPPPPPESHGGVAFIPPIPPQAMYFPMPDPQLKNKIVNQINYYFSNENLVKDTYLRLKMDEQGWVPIKTIADFRKVKDLTNNIQLILDALRTSNVVEVKGDKIRKLNDWRRWIMPLPPVQISSPSAGRPGDDTLATSIQSMSLQ
ncbi:la-related protein 1B-like isoform X2 [Diospyros lotus]|uniref:la-related protein 1B-like isoform X2 n=1 Tax=Diospyros lotus TaxID=55363 RepID=UPI00225099E4|nr:la-related protein 1B-like isoform X2 [Diospyros lotus]